MSSAQQQMLTGFGEGAGAVTDPHFANVVFLWEAEGVDGTSNSADLKNGRTITGSGTGHIEADQARFGGTSYFVGTGGCSLANHSDWRLGNSTNTSPFTIEFSAYQTTLNQWETLIQFGSSPNKSWWLRLQADGQMRFLASSDGSTSFTMDITTTGLGTTSGAWHDFCIEKDTSGKIRFYRNGVTKYSTTPANSVFAAVTQSLVFSTHPSGGAYLDHMRFTSGVARYANDTGYTFVESAFPTS